MNIPVTPEIERELAEEARRQGTTPELLALDCLRAKFLDPARVKDAPLGTGTLADFLAGHLGVLSSSESVPGGARMSEDSAKKFGAGMLKKRKQGRL
jgi:hypothetical protein